MNDTSASQAFGTSVTRASIGANNAGNFNEGYCALRTLGANNSENLDLSGSLVNLLGETITFARVYSISVENISYAAGGNNNTLGGNATSISVGNAANNQWQGPLSANATETVKNGGVWINADNSAAGWTVTNNSADVLMVKNNDANNAAVYRICLSGATS